MLKLDFEQFLTPIMSKDPEYLQAVTLYINRNEAEPGTRRVGGVGAEWEPPELIHLNAT